MQLARRLYGGKKDKVNHNNKKAKYRVVVSCRIKTGEYNLRNQTH